METYTPPTTAILHHTTAYFDSRPPSAPVHIVQYDFTLPIVAVALYNGAEPYTVPNGGTVSIRMGKSDGTIVYNPALGLDAARSTAYIAVTPQMTIFAGDFKPVLEVSSGRGIAATSTLSLIIDPNPVPEDKIKSADEYKTVQQLAALAAASAAAAAESAQNAAASETAAGTAQAGAESAQTGAAGSATSAASSASQAAADAATASQKAAAAAASAQAAQEAAEQAQQVAQGALGYYVDVDALKAAHPTGTAGQWAIVGNPDGIWVWDVEGEEWVNSGQHIDLSDYYNKQQTDSRINAAKGSVFLIPVPASGWQGTAAPYTNTVTVEGVTAQMILSAVQLAPSQVGNDDAEQAYTQWSYLDTQAGAVQFTAETDKPTADFTILAHTTESMQSANDVIDVDTLKAQILLAAHPVGSYYWSDVDTSPETLFGGTWEAVQNKFVFAAGEGHEAGSTGGEESHTLTVDEMPSHNHKLDATGLAVVQGGKSAFAFNTGADYGSNSGTYTGGSQSHNNMPPYITAYCWRRTA